MDQISWINCILSILLVINSLIDESLAQRSRLDELFLSGRDHPPICTDIIPCGDLNAFCKPTPNPAISFCQCRPNYRYGPDQDKCIKLAEIGQPCDHSDECKIWDENSICDLSQWMLNRTSICACKSKYIYDPMIGQCIRSSAKAKDRFTTMVKMILIGIGFFMISSLLTCFLIRRFTAFNDQHRMSRDSHIFFSSPDFHHHHSDVSGNYCTDYAFATDEPPLLAIEEDKPPSYEDAVSGSSYYQKHNQPPLNQRHDTVVSIPSSHPRTTTTSDVNFV